MKHTKRASKRIHGYQGCRPPIVIWIRLRQHWEVPFCTSAFNNFEHMNWSNHRLIRRLVSLAHWRRRYTRCGMVARRIERIRKHKYVFLHNDQLVWFGRHLCRRIFVVRALAAPQLIEGALAHSRPVKSSVITQYSNYMSVQGFMAPTPVSEEGCHAQTCSDFHLIAPSSSFPTHRAAILQ